MKKIITVMLATMMLALGFSFTIANTPAHAYGDNPDTIPAACSQFGNWSTYPDTVYTDPDGYKVEIIPQVFYVWQNSGHNCGAVWIAHTGHCGWWRTARANGSWAASTWEYDCWTAISLTRTGGGYLPDGTPYWIELWYEPSRAKPNQVANWD